MKALLLAFNIALWGHWTSAHHKPMVEYQYHHKLLPIAAQWVKHEKMCGGALIQAVWNDRTLHWVQDFEKCYAVMDVYGNVVFFKYP